MEQQLSFFGQDNSSLQKHNLFTALLPNGRGIRLISDFRGWLEQQYGPLGMLVPPEQLHITLVDLGEHRGEIPKGEIRRALAACEEAAKVPAFPISLDRVESWQTPLVMLGPENSAL